MYGYSLGIIYKTIYYTVQFIQNDIIKGFAFLLHLLGLCSLLLPFSFCTEVVEWVVWKTETCWDYKFQYTENPGYFLATGMKKKTGFQRTYQGLIRKIPTFQILFLEDETLWKVLNLPVRVTFYLNKEYWVSTCVTIFYNWSLVVKLSQLSVHIERVFLCVCVLGGAFESVFTLRDFLY